ncbi:hypothetical protein KBZ21_38230, partial [Streptomyces sp. A73]|nr:hypothetical protein [Streptomyces sp. A73]
ENEPQTGAQRRERFRTAVYQAIERGDDPAEAAMAVADAEQAELRAERDRARSTAVALENQLAAVRGLHVDSYTTRGVGRGTDTP